MRGFGSDYWKQRCIQSLLHLGAGAFEEIGRRSSSKHSLCLEKTPSVQSFKGEYYRLIDGITVTKRENCFLNGGQKYIKRNTNFRTIPGCPHCLLGIRYQSGAFSNKPFRLGNCLNRGRDWLQEIISDFLRLWHEVDINRIGFDMRDDHEASLSGKKWFPYNKGGAFRKWYGNQEYVINWENDGADIKEFDRAVIRNPSYYFRSGITWSFVGSARFWSALYSAWIHF